MGDVIPFASAPGPVPPDEVMEIILHHKIEASQEFLEEILEMMRSTIEETQNSEQPFNFSYAKLLKYLKEGITESQVVNACAAAIWALITESNDSAT